MHLGDTAKQMDCTFKVAGAILEAQGMNWANATRLLVYLKHAADFPVYERFAREHGYDRLPALIVNTDICRDDLLFEIEVDALGPR